MQYPCVQAWRHKTTCTLILLECLAWGRGWIERDCGEANKDQVGHIVTRMTNWGIWKFLQMFLIAFRLIKGVTWSDLPLEVELIDVWKEKSDWKRKVWCPYFHWKTIDWFLQWLEHDLKLWGHKAKKTWTGPAHRIAGKQAFQEIRISCGKIYSQSSYLTKWRAMWETARSVCVLRVEGEGRESNDGLHWIPDLEAE